MVVICTKQHLGNIRSSIMKKLSNTEAELKKTLPKKKACTLLAFLLSQ